MSIFENIDFNNLPEDYNEICVREEIIAPLLKLLGYSSSDKSKCIVREPHLKQPFTQMGTKNFKISIIPDYLIKVNGKNFFIIEAKSPRESILSRKYIQQAYSYAINMEVKAKYFVLCNGKGMSIYDVNNEEESFPLNFSAYLSKETIKNENEIYLPLIVKEFLK